MIATHDSLQAAARERAFSLPIEQVDPSDPQLFADDTMHHYFARLRRDDPVHWVQSPRYGGFWSVTRYQDIMAVDTNHAVFSSEWSKGGITLYNPPDSDKLPMFIAMDPPKHTGQRRTVAPSFGPSEVAAMKAECAARTGEVLDSLPIGEPFDWVQRVSIELTTGMLAKLFGFPWEERHKLTEWSDYGGDVELIKSPETIELRLAKMQEMGMAFAALWQERMANPGKDLISVMLQSDAMREMEPEEFIGNLILLIVGGNDTTRNSMSGGVLALNQFPEEFAKLKANPDLIPNMVSEIIRWQTPLAHMRRVATQDVELHGQTIKKGDRVLMWYASGNRDERKFENPDQLIIDRKDARNHMSFGYGIHRCMGNRLAELQLRILWEELLKRFDNIEVVGEPERVQSNFVRGYSKLMVKLTAKK